MTYSASLPMKLFQLVHDNKAKVTEGLHELRRWWMTWERLEELSNEELVEAKDVLTDLWFTRQQ